MGKPCAQRREIPCLEQLTKVSYGYTKEGWKLTSNDNHINDINYARMFEGFKDLDFSESSDGHPFLLVVHEDPL